GAQRDAALDDDAGPLALERSVWPQLAPAVRAHRADVVLQREVFTRVRLHLDARARSVAIARHDVDGDRVVVEGERAHARRPRLVARLLLPAGAELLAIEEGVVEHDVAHRADAAVPES